MATQSVNRWRGEIIHWFSRGEVAVSETLLILAADERRGKHIRLRQLFGQRLEDLRTALAPTGAFAAEGARVLAALDEFRDALTHRSALCHGAAKVWLDRSGRWAVSVDLLDFSKTKNERTREFMPQRDAEALSNDLRLRCQRMEAKLTRLRTAIAQQAPSASGAG